MTKHLTILLAALSLFIAFYRIDSYPTQDWDEARRGVNAWSMIQTGDYWNYRYLGEWDNFNTKPPLFTWLVAGSFWAFGPSNFALRLPSALAFLAFLLVVLRFLQHRVKRQHWLLVWLILITVEGVAGIHVARTGDHDMLFVLFVTLGFFAIYRLVIEGNIPSLYRAITFGFLAFLAKSFAMALVLPGVIYWAYLHRSKIKLTRTEWQRGASLFIALSALTLVLLLKFQQQSSGSWMGQNLLFDMFSTDAVTRFSDSSFEKGYKWDFLPVALDIKFGPFIYLLYALLIFGSVKLGFISLIRRCLSDPLSGLVLLVTASAFSLLMLSQNKHQWYVAPIIFPLALLTVRLFLSLTKAKSGAFSILLAVGLLFFGLKVYRISQVESRSINSSEFYVDGDVMYVDPNMRQSDVFQLCIHHLDKRILALDQ